MPIQPGTDIGRYHILEQLGEGGMAVVYKAYDTRLESEVAVKIIRTERLIPEFRDRTLKRFQTEAKKMAQLQHPNIVKVTDFGEFENIPYLVLEYAPSGTLKERIGKPIPCGEAARMLTSVARALAYAHKRGLVHRDVKPSNILITDSGEPMLTDFGITKILDNEETLDLTITGMGIGTPGYMAPEQAEGKPIDERADVYSLGIVFYEMVTGRKPFTADTPLAVLIKQTRDPLPHPSQFVEGLPDDIERVLFKALAKDLKDRYQTMEELGKALGELASKEDRYVPQLKVASIPVQKTHIIPETRGNPKKTKKRIKEKIFDTRWLIGLMGAVGLSLVIFAGIKMAGDGEELQPIVAVETETLRITEAAKTNTPEHTSSSIQVNCINQAEFISETIPDGTIFKPGAEFSKSWTIENTGTCVWNTNYELHYDDGDQLSGPDNVRLPNIVKPDERISIDIDFKAPFSAGFYSNYWQLRSENDEEFMRLFMKITVPGAIKSKYE